MVMAAASRFQHTKRQKQKRGAAVRFASQGGASATTDIPFIWAALPLSAEADRLRLTDQDHDARDPVKTKTALMLAERVIAAEEVCIYAMEISSAATSTPATN